GGASESNTRTWCPCSKSKSTVCEPINPAPPVTNTRITSPSNAAYLPVPLITAGIVKTKILKSSHNDQCRIYSKSSRSHSSKSRISLRPEICQRHVIPGLTASFCFCTSVNSTYSLCSGGRGPTSDISPLKTLHNCGSSSNENFRSTRPTDVMRGSFFILKTGPCISFCASRSA